MAFKIFSLALYVSEWNAKCGADHVADAVNILL